MRRDDVAQFELPALSIDLGRQPEPDEPAFSVERGEAFPGPVAPPGLVCLDPVARESLRRRLRDSREPSHLGIRDQVRYVIEPSLAQALEPDLTHRSDQFTTAGKATGLRSPALLIARTPNRAEFSSGLAVVKAVTFPTGITCVQA